PSHLWALGNSAKDGPRWRLFDPVLTLGEWPRYSQVWSRPRSGRSVCLLAVRHRRCGFCRTLTSGIASALPSSCRVLPDQAAGLTATRPTAGYGVTGHEAP